MAWISHNAVTDNAVLVATAASTAPEPNMWMYLLGGGSLVTILGMAGRGVKAVLTGRVASQTRRDASLVLQRDTAWEERDEAKRAQNRAERNLRLVSDHAGTLRYLLNKYGVPAHEIPSFPHLERDPQDPVHSTPNT